MNNLETGLGGDVVVIHFGTETMQLLPERTVGELGGHDVVVTVLRDAVEVVFFIDGDDDEMQRIQDQEVTISAPGLDEPFVIPFAARQYEYRVEAGTEAEVRWTAGDDEVSLTTPHASGAFFERIESVDGSDGDGAALEVLWLRPAEVGAVAAEIAGESGVITVEQVFVADALESARIGATTAVSITCNDEDGQAMVRTRGICQFGRCFCSGATPEGFFVAFDVDLVEQQRSASRRGMRVMRQASSPGSSCHTLDVELSFEDDSSTSISMDRAFDWVHQSIPLSVAPRAFEVVVELGPDDRMRFSGSIESIPETQLAFAGDPEIEAIRHPALTALSSLPVRRTTQVLDIGLIRRICGCPGALEGRQAYDTERFQRS